MDGRRPAHRGWKERLEVILTRDTILAALIFALMTALAVSFQIALALGAPWGHLAMGGRYPGQFPKPMRVAALAQAAPVALVMTASSLIVALS